MRENRPKVILSKRAMIAANPKKRIGIPMTVTRNMPILYRISDIWAV
jgi:hypothetical protein